METAGEGEEIFTAIAGEKKYLLLKADTSSGEGEVVYQPWRGKVSPTSCSSISALTGPANSPKPGRRAGFCDWAERYARFLKEKPAKVIPLRRPRGEAE